MEYMYDEDFGFKHWYYDDWQEYENHIGDRAAITDTTEITTDGCVSWHVDRDIDGKVLRQYCVGYHSEDNPNCYLADS